MSAIGIEIDQDQLVLTRGRDFRWSFENLDTSNQPVAYPPGELFFALDTGGEHNCVQQVEVIGADDGSYKLGYDGVKSDPIDYYKSTDTPYDLTIDIRSALENIPAIGAGNVAISSTGLNPVWHLNFTLTGNSQNEIQELSVVNLLGWLGEQLGEGQMVLSYRETDAEEPISFEANAATIQASLETIPQIGKGNVIVTEPVADHFHVEFVGLLAARDVDQIKVRAYEKNAGDFFGGGITGNLLTVFSTKTIQNGRRAVLDGRMMDTLSKKILEFFNIFDDKQPMSLEFVIKDNKTFTVICRSLKGYQAIDLATFDVIFSANTVKTFLGNQILLAGAVSTLTVDQYWNHRYTVEFINEAGNRPHPLLVGDASGLSSGITTTPIAPTVRTEYVDRGQSATTLWPFLIEGTLAHLKVESEDADRIPARTRWQLVFLPEGEEIGGDPIARGTITEQR
ncbi:hypothetical protein SEA_ZIMMER_6 [Mycobacterium phage Zimmer]|nr:hypothetical protein SEA_ZIMMER_6 [Mycobacterium phage Zimmer]